MSGGGGPPATVPRLLVDAANVVGSRPDGWWRDRAGAAARLAGRLAAHQGGPGAWAGPVLLVVEGAARGGVPAGVQDGVEVHHAPGSGDDLLAALARPGDLVVTSDRGLAARVAAAGAEVRGAGWLLGRLDAQEPPVSRSAASPPDRPAPGTRRRPPRR